MPLRRRYTRRGELRLPGPLLLSPGRIAFGLRWGAHGARPAVRAGRKCRSSCSTSRPRKVRESLHATLIAWARQTGEGGNYTDNLPVQCLHPVGHWYEVPNLLPQRHPAAAAGAPAGVEAPVGHNIDTAGVDLDAALLGYHIEDRRGPDHGGDLRATSRTAAAGLARVDGRVRLVEGLALPDDEIESRLSYYNSATYWVDIDQLLTAFGLTRSDLADTEKLNESVRRLAIRMPTYITLKDVKKRWGKGRKMSSRCAIREAMGRHDRPAGAEMPLCSGTANARPATQGGAQLDGWLRDGSAAYVEGLCGWRRDGDAGAAGLKRRLRDCGHQQSLNTWRRQLRVPTNQIAVHHLQRPARVAVP